ncbi:MAG: extracellular solute-binding protein [Tepidisphaeraceae bacterium]
MRAFSKWVAVIGVALVIAWAFFDVARRYVHHRQQLSQRPIELTVLHWGDPTEDRIVADLVERFTQQHADVRIVRINAGEKDFPNKLKTLMAAGTPPDVFYLKPALLPELAENKLLEPLDCYFDPEPAQWKTDFWPLLISAMRYDPATGALGHGPLWGLPKDFTTAGFYINVDLFERAGVDWRDIQSHGWDWPRFEAEMKKITALTGTPGFEGRTIYGTQFQLWHESLRNILWTYGGEFFATKPDGTPDYAHLALDSPGSQAALNVIRRMRLDDKTAFNATGIAKDGGQEFKVGNVGCIGPVGQWFVPQLEVLNNLRWDIVPVPRGTQAASQTFYNGWAMAAHGKHPDKSYELIRFLCGRDGQVQQARAGLGIPALQSVAKSDDFLRPPTRPVRSEQVFLDAIPHARVGNLPKQSEFTQIVQSDLDLAILAGRLTTQQAAELTQADWSKELNSPLRTHDWPKMPWGLLMSAVGVFVVAAVLAVWWKARREHLGAIDRASERSGFAFIAPWLVGFAVFTLGPMLISLVLAFSQWSGMVPIGDAKFVGAANFKQLFAYDPLFIQSLKVTAYFVILGVPISQVAALLIALLMNNQVRGIGLFRTVYFVPSVVSGAALAVLWLQLFNNEYGLINKLLAPVTHLFNTNPPNWFGYDILPDGTSINDAARWAMPGFVLMGLWGVGSGMLIYLAGLKGISPSLYEAARIDGAGPLRRAWNVTLPMLSPLIFYNLVMGLIGSFQVFTQAYIMTGPGPENSTLFYVLQLYRQAFEYHNMGYASAMAWVLFVLVLVLTLGVFRGSKKLVYYEGLR